MNTCPKCYRDNPSKANFCMNCGTKLISSDDLFAENAKIKRQFLAMQSDNLISKKIIEDNTDAHTIFYGSIKKIEHEWIDQNAISHEFANGFGKIKLNDEVTEIEDFVSQDCEELYYITIPNGITAIKDYAISSCEIKSIFIPSSVTEISESAFFCCNKLLSIVVDKRNKVYDSRDNCNAIIETATNTLIKGCVNTKIPDSVTKIGADALSSNEDLMTISIPNSITEIGESAFSFCENLTAIEIPNSVTEIGRGAFMCCSNLKTIVMPNSVKAINDDTFKDCVNLETVIIPESVTEIGNNAFVYCKNLKNIEIPRTVTKIGNLAFALCNNLNEETKIRIRLINWQAFLEDDLPF